jgi:mono/diheme cytochrome c family protein
MPSAKAVVITLSTLILLTLVICYGLLRSGSLSARDKPGFVEYAIANYALDLSIPAAAKRERNPIPATPDALVAGTKSFSENCAVCHGNDGAGRTNTAKGLSPGVPNLRAEHVQKLADGQMFYLIKDGIRFTGMPAWDLRDEQIWKLVLVIRQFAKEPAPSKRL